MTNDLHDLLIRAGDVLAAPSVAPPASEVRRAGERRRRRRTMTTGLAAFAVLAGSVGAVVSLHGDEQTLTPAAPRSASVEDDGLRLEIQTDRDVVHAATSATDPLRVTVTLTNGRDEAVRLGDTLRDHEDREDVRIGLSVQYPSDSTGDSTFAGPLRDLRAQWVGESMIPFFALVPQNADGTFDMPPYRADRKNQAVDFRDVVVQPGESVTRVFAWPPDDRTYAGYSGKIGVTALISEGREAPTPRRDPFTGADQMPSSLIPAPTQVSVVLDLVAEKPTLTRAQAADAALSDPQFAAWVESVGGPPAEKWNGSFLEHRDGRWEGWLDTKDRELGLPEGYIALDDATGEVLFRRLGGTERAPWQVDPDASAPAVPEAPSEG